jgi:hypothetical protein
MGIVYVDVCTCEIGRRLGRPQVPFTARKLRGRCGKVLFVAESREGSPDEQYISAKNIVCNQPCPDTASGVGVDELCVFDAWSMRVVQSGHAPALYSAWIPVT